MVVTEVVTEAVAMVLVAMEVVATVVRTDPASATATDTVERDGVGCRAAGGGRGSAAGDWLSGSPPRDGAREKARKSTPAADPESAPVQLQRPTPTQILPPPPEQLQTAAAEATRTKAKREDAAAAAVASHAAALSTALEVRAVAVEYDEEHQHPTQNLTQLPQQHWWLGAAEVQNAGRG